MTKLAFFRAYARSRHITNDVYTPAFNCVTRLAWEYGQD